MQAGVEALAVAHGDRGARAAADGRGAGHARQVGHASSELVSVGPAGLLLCSLGLRRVTLLLLVTVGRETLRAGAAPALPDAGERLGVGDASLERRTPGKTRLRWRQVVEFFLIL